MELRGKGLRLFNSCTLALFTFIVATSTWARLVSVDGRPPRAVQIASPPNASPCTKILSESNDDRPLRETKSGEMVYREIARALGRNSTTFAQLNRGLETSNMTVDQVLKFMKTDRDRLVSILTQTQSKLSESDPVYWLINNAKNNMTRSELEFQGNIRSEESMLAQYRREYGKMPWWQFRDEHMGQNADIAREISSYYQKNYSFISELLTALEVRGLVAANEHFNQMLPSLQLERLRKHLRESRTNRFAKRASGMIKTELDAVTVDHVRGVMTWFEVKHPSRRIESINCAMAQNIIHRIQWLRRLIQEINSDPKLHSQFPYPIELRFVIRGGGITPEMISLFWQRYGIEIEDGGVSQYNAHFGVVAKKHAR